MLELPDLTLLPTLLAILETHGPQTPEELAHATGLTFADLRPLLGRLEDAALVSHVSGYDETGTLFWSPEGPWRQAAGR